MTDMTLADALREEVGELPPSLDMDTVQNVLTEPEQDTLAQAVAADLVDGAPIIGDLLAIQKLEKAEQRGIDYPDTPIFVQDVTGDLPTPLDLMSDAILWYHTPHYLREEYGVEVRNPPQEAVEALAQRTESFIN